MQGEENHISSVEAFLNLDSFFSAFLSYFCLYSYTRQSGGVWKQFKQLANAKSFSTPRGTVRLTDGKQQNQTRTGCFCQIVWPWKGFWRKSQRLLSGCGHSDRVCFTSMAVFLILKPFVLYIVHIVTVYPGNRAVQWYAWNLLSMFCVEKCCREEETTQLHFFYFWTMTWGLFSLCVCIFDSADCLWLHCIAAWWQQPNKMKYWPVRTHALLLYLNL